MWVVDYDNVGNHRSNLEIIRKIDDLKSCIKEYKYLESKGYSENLEIYKISSKLSEDEINKLLERDD